MKTIIFGGSGFIGSRLRKSLEQADREIVVGDIQKPKDGIPYVNSDIRKLDQVEEACKGTDTIVNLAAVHRDDVSPTSEYYDTNVHGSENICKAANALGINKIIFTSSVAVYGFSDGEKSEEDEPAPENHYGKSKLQAEKVYLDWQKAKEGRSLVIVRPTVVFGEENRGNVYNLIKQISKNMYFHIGNGKNIKSIAYVGNVAAFIAHCIDLDGLHIYNYADKPDLDLEGLVAVIREELGFEPNREWHIPHFIGYLFGLGFDVLSFLTRKKLPLSRVRVKKLCANTIFNAKKIKSTGFTPEISIEEGIKRTIQGDFKDRILES